MFPTVILTAFVPICEHRDIWQLQTCYDISDLYLKSYSSEGPTSHTIRFTFQFRDFISRTICVVSVFSFIASLDINPEAYFSLWRNMLCSDFFYNIRTMLLLRVNKDVYVCLSTMTYMFSSSCEKKLHLAQWIYIQRRHLSLSIRLPVPFIP